MSEMENKNINRREFEVELIAKAWQDKAFKKELLTNPKMIYEKKLTQELPSNIEIKVLEETPNNFYLIIPHQPANTEISEELSDDKLEAVAGGWAVSVAVAAGGIIDF